jgi:hypothetical protein
MLVVAELTAIVCRDRVAGSEPHYQARTRILFWCIHAFLTLSGTGPHWARWGARWGCLALVPLAWVALLVWAHYFLPPTDGHIYSDGAPGRLEALWSLFLSPFAWITFMMLELLLMRLGIRRERRRDRLSS